MHKLTTMTLIITLSFILASCFESSSEQPAPPPITAPLPPTDGPTLYANNCASCHGALATSSKLNRSASQIQAAIDTNIGGMGALTGLTPADVRAIADALASDTTPPPDEPVGVTINGAIYYQNNCAACHKVGQDDPVSAFGASDLAQRHDMMTSDMSNFDTTSSFNMMGAYAKVPAQRVADLKAYLKSVPKI